MQKDSKILENNKESTSLENNENTKNNDNIIQLPHGLFEICEMSEDDVAGRVKIVMTALEIHSDNSKYNKNGITWLEEYVQENLSSIIGCPYTVCWLDEESQIPSDHGEMTYDENGDVQFEGVAVGSIQDAYIESRIIDGEEKKVLTTVGYIYRQRYPKFVDFLRQELKTNKVYGSVEINGKGKNKNIEYLDGNTNEDGTTKIGRIPTKFDFSGLSILYMTIPADDNSQILEINSKQNISDLSDNNQEKGGKNQDMENNMKLIVQGEKIVEINKLEAWDLRKILEKSFRIAIGDIYESYSYGYYVDMLYPLNSEFIIKKWTDGEQDKYYQSSYKMNENGQIVIGDIYEVEEDWVPKNNEKPIEMNKQGGESMDYKQQYEKMQQDYETMKKDFDTMKTSYEQMQQDYETMKSNCEQMIKEKETMSKDMETNSSKVNEVNEALVNANKQLEETNAKMNQMQEELNTYKVEHEEIIAEKKKAEINSYFENEIKKNNFTQEEINSLQTYVDKVDLDGLKNAETELCVKKFKEISQKKESQAEVNSFGFSFVHTKEVDNSDTDQIKLFNN